MSNEIYSQTDLQNLLDILDCGVVKIRFDNEANRHIVWANEGFFLLTGHGREGYEHGPGADPRNVVHPDDFTRVFDAFHKNAETNEPLNIEYRIIHKSGRIVWLSVKSNFIGYENGCPTFINVMIDITEQKRIRDAFIKKSHRLAHINRISNEILFEYNTATDIFKIYGNNRKALYLSEIKNLKTAMDTGGLIHPEDEERFFGFTVNAECSKGINKTKNMRFRYANGEYRWCYVLYETDCRTINQGVTILGKIVDNHQAVLAFKQLKDNSARDSMTGLYNKKACMLFVQKYLEQGSQHVLLMLDIDNFKNVNDTYGHDVGDLVISDVAKTIEEVFRQSDVKGRIGGDEFMVLLRDTSPEDARRRINKYSLQLSNLTYEKFPDLCIRTSIGMAFFPDDGDTFEKLFKIADHNMYHVKKECKGSCTLQR